MIDWIDAAAEDAYTRLIRHCQENPCTGYGEKHHIVPRSMNGGDDPDNLILMSAQNHLLAHYWLWVGTGAKRMGSAYFSMANISWTKHDQTPLVTSDMAEAYETARIAHAERARGRTGAKAPNFGNKMSSEARQKISESHKGKKYTEEGKKIRLVNQPNRKEVIQIIDGKKVIFPSVKKCARDLGVQTSTLRYWLKHEKNGLRFA